MSVNKVILIGNVGKEPEIKTFDNGNRVAVFSLATSESWKDKATGEKKEKSQWHNIRVFGGLVGIVESYVKKGTKLYLEGKIETRSYEKDGDTKYITEIVLNGFGDKLEMLNKVEQSETNATESNPVDVVEDFDDEIPF